MDKEEAVFELKGICAEIYMISSCNENVKNANIALYNIAKHMRTCLDVLEENNEDLKTE